MKRCPVLFILLLSCPTALRADPLAPDTSLSDDFQSMMQWLTHETVQGLAFTAGSTFDPPDELAPGKWQPDLSLGVGVVPLDKGRFPNITTQSLADMNPAGTLPDRVTFPNLAVHMRWGLPDRWDVSVRGTDMTIPHGYHMTSKTQGEGQSNSLGLGIRKHFFGGDVPKLSVAANYNHVFGHIDYFNQFKNLELAPGFVVDSLNHGQLAWDVYSIGINAVASQTFGAWTPFLGVGLNRMSGSVSGKFAADFQTPFIVNPQGQASAAPEEYQGRLIFGTQWTRAVLSYFVNGEVKVIGSSAGKTFVMTSGIALPFSVGPGGASAGRGARRSSRSTPQTRASPSTYKFRDDVGTALEIDSESKPVPRMRYREFEKPRRPGADGLDALPEATLIQ